jgi:hypothetical protein
LLLWLKRLEQSRNDPLVRDHPELRDGPVETEPPHSEAKKKTVG